MAEYNKSNIRSHSKPYRAPLLDFRSLYPFSDDFDPGALWGLRRLIRKGAIELVKLYFFIIFLTIVDLFFVFFNLISPNRTPENVIPLPFSPHSPPRFFDHPFIFLTCKLALWLGPQAPQWIQEWSYWDGILSDGEWPPIDRDIDVQTVSRSPCPGLNALANHGIINKSGETLNFHRIASRVSRTYNLSPALAVQLLSAAWPLFKDRGQIDLYSLTTHGLIEHDASLLRPDLNESTLEDQTKPNQELIEKHFPKRRVRKTRSRIQKGDESDEEEEIEEETDEIRLRHSDFSNLLEKRREECKTNNPSFHETFLFKFFGSGNCAMFMEVFGGKLSDIRPFVGAGISSNPPSHHHHHHHHHRRRHRLHDEEQPRLPAGLSDLINLEVLPHGRWRPSNLHHPWGLTIFKLIYSTLKIEART
ncbi:hypothetical protein PGT21_027816 [Puccinia graminis f. sp. tritici]|uniref:Heme haloperoxidase family profile domain-containing protein n=2 Tax=Puccinia graminis f. sp. tritici TaxID=56615 RepID=E3JRV7_PUCGT|nr:uncharacterized protein PGTG_00594 [Puccinia graminis f. sp. tritici CRL 75-36-700-3]EFP74638.2 hypothetical protein PGTG_00594 [Puccinia graminis f. sp. tritici CRL 75-36-700-3]KAA1114950.1 hypothetical protein PGT21_027816 [Puccinia graminis f. sp. tritici]KAA1127134.1 hypothetical protein PGTUg99_024444 [Puccinia graminis f. sp. tritici]